MAKTSIRTMTALSSDIDNAGDTIIRQPDGTLTRIKADGEDGFRQEAGRNNVHRDDVA